MGKEDKVSDELVEFIKSYEKHQGDHLTGYYATDAEKEDGIVTVGYGSTRRVKYGEKITEEQAEEWLREDLAKSERDVRRLVTVPLEQNEFDSLVSLVYNNGPGKFAKSRALKALNNKRDLKTFDYETYDRDNGFTKQTNPKTKKKEVKTGLYNRRRDEREMFFFGKYDTAYRDGRKRT
jgi:lysozyme